MSYIVRDYEGKSVFWDQTDEAKFSRHKEMWDKLVPLSGECDTQHGELLRMASRLMHDIYNNGLCNDKAEEIDHLIDNFDTLKPYLKDSKSAFKLLAELEQAHRNRDEENSPCIEQEWVDESFTDEDGNLVESGYYEEVEVENEYLADIPVFDQRRTDALDDIVWAATMNAISCCAKA